MTSLSETDKLSILASLPKDVRDLVLENKLIIGGGYIRAKIAREKPSDIDLFGTSIEVLQECARQLASDRQARLYKTDNAITVLTVGRIPIQFITKWLYTDAQKLIESFDFTIAQACIHPSDGQWVSVCADEFYADLAAKRLVYTRPIREEAPGGSIMRVRKFLARGYWIQSDALAGVIARLVNKIRWDEIRNENEIQREEWTSKIIKALLREVDPLTVIDGVEINEDQD